MEEGGRGVTGPVLLECLYRLEEPGHENGRVRHDSESSLAMCDQTRCLFVRDVVYEEPQTQGKME